MWAAVAGGLPRPRLTTGSQSPHGIRWAKKSSGTVYFLNRDGELRSARAGGSFSFLSGGPGEPAKVPFQAKMTVKRDEEFAEMFAQSWRALSDYFYDAKYHGADWNRVREKYTPLVAHVGQREDLYALIGLMLGELNASHLGVFGRLPGPEEPTADLGLLFDESYPGPGLKIAEVLKRGPADKRGINLKAGEIILAIDRTPVTGKVNLSQLLNGKANEPVLLDVTADPKDPKAEKRRVEVTAAERGKIAPLVYDRWVAHNAAQVARESGGKLGYIHIPSMDEEGLEAFVRALYSDNYDKEGIVLDVRYNGGGFTHDQVLNYLVGKEHTVFRQRNGGEGTVMRNYDRKWARPLAVLVNNQSYSDAEIFPHAFRTLGLGKVVGQATGGHVIGTGGIRLIDGSLFRVPRVGVWTVQGVNMEKKGVVPDVPVEQTPEAWAKGQDTQLTEAVKVLTTDVVAWKKARSPTAVAEAPKAQPTQPVATPSRPAAPPTPTPAKPQQAPEPRPLKTGG